MCVLKSHNDLENQYNVIIRIFLGGPKVSVLYRFHYTGHLFNFAPMQSFADILITNVG